MRSGPRQARCWAQTDSPLMSTAAPGEPGEHAQEQQGEEQAPAQQHGGIELEATCGVDLSHRPDGRGGTAARHRRWRAAGRRRWRTAPAPHVTAFSHRVANGTQGAGLPSGVVELLGKSLTDEHQESERESAPRTATATACGLMASWTCWWTVSSLRTAKCSRSRLAPRSGRPSSERGNSGAPADDTNTHPRKRHHPGQSQCCRRGRWGQDGLRHLVELVDQQRRQLNDGGHPIAQFARRHVRGRQAVLELVGHPVTHADAEEASHARGECDLVRRVKWGEMACEDRRRVVGEVFAIGAAGDRPFGRTDSPFRGPLGWRRAPARPRSSSHPATRRPTRQEKGSAMGRSPPRRSH